MSFESQKISFYKSATDNKGTEITIAAAIDFISSNQYKQQTEQYRLAPAGKEKDALKKRLFPAVTWAGTFSKRKAADLKNHIGLIVIDIDKLSPERHDAFKKLLRNDRHVFFLFTSPSGNGLKIIFKIKLTATNNEEIQQAHAMAFRATANYIQQEYAEQADESGKDVSRLCFICYDSDAYYNPECQYFPVDDFVTNTSSEDAPQVQDKKAKPLTKKQESDLSKTLTANDVFEFTQNISSYVDGNRNNFLHLYANNCNRRGIDESECLSFAMSFAHDLGTKEITDTVKSAYKNTLDNGKFAKKSTKPNTGTNAGGGNVSQQSNTGNTGSGGKNRQTSNKHTGPASADAPNTDNGGNTPEQPIKFWYFTEKEDKGGKISKSFNLDYNMLKKFLQQQGFFRLPLKDGNYQFIKITGNRVKPVTPLQIRDFIFNHLESLNEHEACNSLTRGGKQYLSTDKFERLAYREVNIKRHTADTAYFYYNNGMVEVTPDKITLLPYEQLNDTCIWDASINKRSVQILPDDSDKQPFPQAIMDSEVYRFCWLACCNQRDILEHKDNNDSTVYNTWIKENQLIEKFASICTSIGYMLHLHKTPSKAKAIIAIDHQIPADRTEQNGGTGKSIVGNYILKNVLNVATIPGKDYKDDNPWRWEPITIDSQLVFFNDVKYNFNFEGIFELITDDMLINRRNIGYLSIPFESSPKIYIATNFVPKGDGTSFKRRTHIIEFDNYFNETHTPYDEFGHNLFNDWNGIYAEQWNLYDNFIFRCVQMYLQEGLLNYPGGNYEQRKLISECPQEFIDWMDATNETTGERMNIAANKWIEKKTIQTAWSIEAKSVNLQAPSPHQFTKMIKKYCHTKKIELYNKKTNGVEYYSFGMPPTSSPTAPQTSIFK